MEKSRQERIEITLKMEALIDDVREKLMKYPNVREVGYGLRETRGEVTGEPSFKVYVTQKVALKDLKEEDKLPLEIAGFRVDIVEDVGTVLVPAPAGDTSTYKPIWGGVRATGAGAGTLGCWVTLNADGKVHFLSNHHVLMGSTKAIGDLLGHPGAACSSKCCICATIGVLANGQNNALVDCAIGRLYGTNAGDPTKIAYQNSIVGIGPVFGVAPIVTPPRSAVIMGDVVRKRGSRTGLTVGQVINANFSPTGIKTNQILVSVISGARHMVWGGDSGSALVDWQNRVVGLIYARTAAANDNYDTCPVRHGVANHISEVTTAMAVTVMSSGTAGIIPASGIEYYPAPAANPALMFSMVENQLKGRPGGDAFLHAIHENRSEVMDLINDNREVKVAWHRYQGPAFVGHLVKKSNTLEHPVPGQINGYSFQNLLIKMTDVLERQGSRDLSSAVENYSAYAFDFAEDFSEEKLQKAQAAASPCDNCGTPLNTSDHG